jgi:hypothetical protein
MRCAVAVFLGALAVANGSNGRSETVVILIALSFFGLVVGLAIAGPWLTGLAGRLLGRVSRGPVGLLASRRLTDAPSGAFGAISGVVLAVFVASPFSVLIGYANTNTDRGTAMPAGTLIANVGALIPDAATTTPQLIADVRTSPGVADVAAIREGMLGTSEGGIVSVWMVRCADLVATLRITADCNGRQAWAGPNAHLDPADHLSFLADYVFGLDGSDPRYPKPEPLQAGYTVGQFKVDGSLPSFLPDVIIDPGLLADGGARFPLDRLIVATDDSASVAEHVRTLIERTAPGTVVQTVGDVQLSSLGVLGEASRIVALEPWERC